MRTARTKEDFDKLSEIFKRKYEAEHPEFVDYFWKEWVTAHPYWFLGASNLSPTTNNAVESFNGKLKQIHTLRRRLPINQFCIELFSWIEKWSRQYVENNKIFHEIVLISDELWQRAISFSSVVKMVTREKSGKNSNYDTFIVPAGDRFCYTHKDRTNYKDFDEYLDRAFNYYIVKLPKNKGNFLQGSCDCPEFYKKYKCKHLLSIALRLKYVKPPLTACSIKLEGKRGPGRPKKTKKALEKQ